MLDVSPKDFDVEVYGIESTELQVILKQLGRTEHVGQQFGVYKLRMDAFEFDVALPRSEIKSGFGHRGFDVKPDPFISKQKACLRRDFSINAMMLDPLTGRFIDKHNGRKDLENKILRHVSPAFAEDPLRPLRAMQFAARFQLTLHPETALLCKRLLSEATTLPKERVWAEWQKWSHAPHPSYGLQVLKDSGWLQLYPGLEAMLNCPQSPRWHPEGDVWRHTLQVCDQAAAIASRNDIDIETAEYLSFAALCHDLGKPVTTCSDEAGNIRSPDHSQAGLSITKQFLQSIGAPKRLSPYMTALVSEHITHLSGQPTERAVRRLAHRLEPANIELWEMLVEADASGRTPAPPSRPAFAWLQVATSLQHHQNKPAPILNGKMLIHIGFAPGPKMGVMLEKAYQAQLDGLFYDKQSAIDWLPQEW